MGRAPSPPSASCGPAPPRAAPGGPSIPPAGQRAAAPRCPAELSGAVWAGGPAAAAPAFRRWRPRRLRGRRGRALRPALEGGQHSLSPRPVLRKSPAPSGEAIAEVKKSRQEPVRYPQPGHPQSRAPQQAPHHPVGTHRAQNLASAAASCLDVTVVHRDPPAAALDVLVPV